MQNLLFVNTATKLTLVVSTYKTHTISDNTAGSLVALHLVWGQPKSILVASLEPGSLLFHVCIFSA